MAKHEQDARDEEELKKYQEQMKIPKEGLKITLQENTANEGR